ncbi:MAG: hypothetical protein ABWY07_10925 [Burkholderiales bacterium]
MFFIGSGKDVDLYIASAVDTSGQEKMKVFVVEARGITSDFGTAAVKELGMSGIEVERGPKESQASCLH